MSGDHSITSEISPEVLATIQRMAAERGISPERFAGDIVREVAEEEAKLLADIERGRAEIARGEGLTHDELIASLRRWKRDSRRAA